MRKLENWLLLLLLIFNFHTFAQTNVSERHVDINHGVIKQEEISSKIFDVYSGTSTGLRRSYRIEGVITLNITTTHTTCQDANGSIIAIATGGTAPYTYTLNTGWSSPYGHFPQVRAGSYTLTVSDATGESVSTPITITNTNSAPHLYFQTYTPATCNVANATATMAVIGGTPPFLYSMDGINWQTSNFFSNLYQGFYTFFVKDANGCTNESGTIGAGHFLPDWRLCDVNIGFNYTQFACGPNGFIAFSNSDPRYSYSLDGVNYQLAGNFTGLTPGNYLIRQKFNNTVYLIAFSMPERCYLKMDLISVDATCQQSDGAINITASNGVPPYQYTLDGINYQSSNVFSGLAASAYFVTVKDAAGYRFSSGITVRDNCPVLTLAALNETCSQSNGTITATGTKGTAPYQYSLDGINFQSSNIFNNLSAGSYSVTLKDASGYTRHASISLSNTCITLTQSIINATCGSNNGKATINATSGQAPFQFSLDGINFQSSNVFSGLPPGNYSVWGKDANGLLGSIAVVIAAIPPPQISFTTVPTSCANNDGVITLTATAGTTPYEYKIGTSNYQSGGVFTGLVTGGYTLSVRDGSGCIVPVNVMVETNCLSVSAIVTNETCGQGNGSLVLTGSHGQAPYQYSIDGANFQNSNAFNNIAAGNYTIYIRDAVGTVRSQSVIVINICPVVILTVTNGICGTANGKINASGSGGIPPYQYSIDAVNFQPQAIFENLPTGNHTITIKDNSGLHSSASVFVNNFPGPSFVSQTTDASCLNNDGKISLIANGGTTPLTYSIDGSQFQAQNSFSNLNAGNYNATVKDVKGCTAANIVSVAYLDNLQVNMPALSEICQNTSKQLPVLSNGDSFSWQPAVGLSNTQVASPLANPQQTTNYILTSQLGICTRKDTLQLVVNPAPIAKAGVNETICFGQNLQLNGIGGDVYHWSPATYLSSASIQNPIVTRPLNTVTYRLKVTDSKGCSSLIDDEITIQVTPKPKLFAGRDTSVIMNTPFQLRAIDESNSGFINYTWTPSYGLNNPSLPQPVATLDREITYRVTATTAAGCEGTDDITLKVYLGPDIYVPTAFSPNNDGKNDVLKVTAVGIREFRYFSVYNREGQQVFSTKDPAKGWDGKIGNVFQSSMAFVWICEGVDEKGNIIRKKGTVTLIK